MSSLRLASQLVGCKRATRHAHWQLTGVAFTWLSACGGVTSTNTAEAINTAGGQSNTVGGTGNSAGASWVAIGGIAGSSSIPADTRPAPPEWHPAIPLGAPGWRQSTVPYCDTHQGQQYAFDVWADSRGAYALVAMGCTPASMSRICTGAEGWGLQFNDGSGWQLLYGGSVNAPVASSVHGFPEGPVILPDYNPTAYVTGSITFFDGSNIQAQPPLAGANDLIGNRVFATSPNHAFVLDGQYSETGDVTAVYEYTSGNWSQVATLPIRGLAIWADSDNVVVVGSNQSIYLRKGVGAEFSQLSGVPAGDYTSVWAWGPDDIWAGNGGQIVHFDGTAFQVVPTNARNGFAQLWGSEGELYFRSFSEFGRWNGTSMETLITSGAGLDIADMWGISRNEVFLAVNDSQLFGNQCGGNILVWYDGATFHQL